MRVIIAGTRTIHDRAVVEKAIEDSGLEITTVYCGGAAGVDRIGMEWAHDNEVACAVFKADWGKWGKAAGPIRNAMMANSADALILVWNGKSRGSANMLKHAKERALKIHEVIV